MMKTFLHQLLFLTMALGHHANAFGSQDQDQKLRKQVQKLQSQSLESRLAYDLVKSLTTKVGARLAGSKAEASARQWAKKEFKKLGLKRIRIEPFEVDHWTRTYEKAEIISPFPQELHMTALGGSIGTGKEGVTAQVVRFQTFDDLKEAPLTGFENKIIFVDEWMTRTQDGSGYGVAVRKRSGAAHEAGKRKAVAALIRSVGTDHHRFPHTGQMGYAKDIPKVPIAALSAPDADQLNRALQYDPKTTVKLSIEVKTGGRLPSGNVIAEIPGKTKEIVLIGAHLDSWDLGTGAVDDGAGVGIVMAAAKMILNLKQKPKRTIRIVLFGAEEVGLIGAKAYAQKYKDQLSQHVVAAESDFGADTIWRLDTRFKSIHAEKQGRYIHTFLRDLGIAYGDNQASGGPDLIPMRRAGVPVVNLQQNGWDYFDLHHTADDTFDKINPNKLAQNVAAYASFAWVVANMDDLF